MTSAAAIMAWNDRAVGRVPSRLPPVQRRNPRLLGLRVCAFTKVSRVLGHAELFEPIGNLLHGRKPPPLPSLRALDEDTRPNLRREFPQLALNRSPMTAVTQGQLRSV
jgi:hypothetical protein